MVTHEQSTWTGQEPLATTVAGTEPVSQIVKIADAASSLIVSVLGSDDASRRAQAPGRVQRSNEHRRCSREPKLARDLNIPFNCWTRVACVQTSFEID
jgi:hypothetical protein